MLKKFLRKLRLWRRNVSIKRAKECPDCGSRGLLVKRKEMGHSQGGYHYDENICCLDCSAHVERKEGRYVYPKPMFDEIVLRS